MPAPSAPVAEDRTAMANTGASARRVPRSRAPHRGDRLSQRASYSDAPALGDAVDPMVADAAPDAHPVPVLTGEVERRTSIG